eukprot:TRINITY_DN11573_c2_g7_i1.p1 TRINITY_DN11573_c2_g7~~TRINITY_DN11573_c2_g7_i1.p1  ORF type:complete len:208 (+),score=51.57 TRINITY_DN11573_c2_g7_i1:23-625(+)
MSQRCLRIVAQTRSQEQLENGMLRYEWVNGYARWLTGACGEARQKSEETLVFESRAVPEVSLADYVNTLWDSAVRCRMEDVEKCWHASFVLMSKMHKRIPELLTKYTAHRLVLTVFVLAMKLTTERPLSNKISSKYGGVMLPNLNSMEHVLLRLMDFDVFIHKAAYDQAFNLLKVPSPTKRRLTSALSFAHGSTAAVAVR